MSWLKITRQSPTLKRQSRSSPLQPLDLIGEARWIFGILCNLCLNAFRRRVVDRPQRLQCIPGVDDLPHESDL
jgi:hypothetical protein|tara:strand:- start:40482 stop:40700 length:219 start_codon:yes stop_codon:yes gene_type:complete